jgi:hypothetical protein
VHSEQVQRILLCVHVTEGGHAGRFRMCRGSVQHVGYHVAQGTMSLEQVAAEFTHRCGQCLMRKCVGVWGIYTYIGPGGLHAQRYCLCGRGGGAACGHVCLAVHYTVG